MIKKITLKNSVKIINNEYVIKKRQGNILDTYNYLLSRSFDYFPELIKDNGKEIYYKYISDINEPNEQKIIDLMNLLSLLHSKTTIYKEIDLDTYKLIYENINTQIIDLYNYYNNLMDHIDTVVYMSPVDYLVARNITNIYNMLEYAKTNINKWYKLIENKRKVRVVTIHNNASLEHYVKNDKSYLISWDNSTVDMPIYDIINVYKKHYLDFDFGSILKVYFNKYPFTSEEITLFLTIIAIPDKIRYYDSQYQMVIVVRRMLDYIYKTMNLIIEYDKDSGLKKENIKE